MKDDLRRLSKKTAPVNSGEVLPNGTITRRADGGGEVHRAGVVGQQQTAHFQRGR